MPNDVTPETHGHGRWTWLGHAAAAVAAATLARLALDPLLGNGYPFTTYFVAAAAVAGFGRTRTAALALVGGGLLAVYLFAPPRYSFPLADPDVLAGLAVYLTVGGIIIAMSRAMRMARRQAESLLTGAVAAEADARRAERAEAEQRERLRTTLASIGDAVITTDTDGRVTSLNPVAETLTGWATADAAGQPLVTVFQIVNESTRRPVENPAIRALRDGVVVGLANHTVLIARDGTERPIDDSAAPIRCKDGEVVGCVLVFRDITERRRAETEREKAQEQVATTLESITDAFIRFDRDWRVVYLNAEAERIDGRPRADILGKTLWDLWPGTAGTPFEAEYRRAVADRVTVEFENLYEPWGRWFAVKGFPTADGGLAVYTRDITAQKQAQEQLRTVEERAAFVRRASGVGFWYCDLPFDVLQWDELVKAHFHLPPDAAVTIDTFYDRIHPDDREPTRAAIDRSIRDRTGYDTEYRTVAPDGGAVRWVRAIGRTFYAPDGTPTRFDGVTLDVTDEKRAAAELRASEERLRLAVAAAKLGQWNLDLRTREMTCSDGCRANYGRRPGDRFTYDDLWAMVHPDDRDRVQAEVRRAVETRTDYDTEYRVVWPDGSPHWVIVRGQARYAPDGTPLDMAGVTLDVTDRREAEERLRASEERFRTLFETMDEGFCIIEFLDGPHGPLSDYVHVLANPAYTANAGIPDIVGQKVREMVPAEADAWVETYRRVLTTGEPVRFERELVATGRHLDLAAFRVEPPQRRQVAVLFTDITARKRAEEAVRASEARNSFLVALADTVRPLSDPIEVQAAASRVLGERLGANRVVYFEIRGDEYVIERDYTAGVRPLAGRYPVAAFGPALLAALLAGRTVVEADATAEPDRPAGERAAFAGIQVRGHVDVPLVKDGRFVAGMTVHASDRRDWTPETVALIEETAERTWAAVERVRAEAALRASEEQRRLALDAAESGAWNIDPTTNVLTSDDRFRIISSGSTDPLTYEAAFAAIHQDDRERVRGAVAAATNPDDPARYAEEYRVVHPDGSTRWVFGKGRANFERTAAGRRLVSFDGTVTDVTARKLIDDDLRRLAADLSEADRRKNEFLATLAHELRNPLAPIRNGLQILAMTGDNPAAVEKTRTMMERQLGQMVRLVDDLMDVSRISRGKLELKTERVSLAAVVGSAVEASRPLIDQMGHHLTVALPDEPIALDADLTRLAQVVMNLLNNAAKYSDRGGHITLTARRDGGAVVLSVKDTGIGLPADQLDRIFEMFSQVDHAAGKSQGGLGIGLCLVKRLVEMHGGTIEARSDGPGKGSEFVVRLPAGAATGARPADAGDGPAPRSALHILVVDDNRDGADSLSDMLRLMGNEVATAYDGQEGLAAAEAFRPDVLVTDIGMPKMDGLELAGRVRGRPWGKGVTVIALTGWGQDDDIRKTREAGIDRHLVKPVNPAALMKLLAEMGVAGAG